MWIALGFSSHINIVLLCKCKHIVLLRNCKHIFLTKSKFYKENKMAMQAIHLYIIKKIAI